MDADVRRPAADCVLAVDIGGSKAAVGLITADGAILCHDKLPLPRVTGPDELLAHILPLARRIAAQATGRVCGAGVAIPGLADPAAGVWLEAAFSGLSDFPIAAVLGEALDLPVYIENDGNLCALAERRYGCCRTTDHFLWITVSNGIGGGVFLGGHLYTGAFGSAGEIGHCRVRETGGHRCGCGNDGCLEAEAAGPAIRRRYGELTGRDADARAVAQAARAGDPLARQVYEETGRYLGKAVSQAVNLLNPQKVVFGGGVSLDADLFLPTVQETVRASVYGTANAHLVLEASALRYDAALLGCAALVWNTLELTEGTN